MRATLLLFSILSINALGHADWLNFRGPNGSGLGDGIKDLPTELTDESVAWKIPLPGRGLSSPLIVGDRLFLSAASGPEQRQLHLLCFDRRTGEPLWERKFLATGRTMSHKKTSVAAPTPASDGERIYAIFSSNDLFCVDLDGNLIWMRALTLDYPNASNSLGMASSPIVAGDTLIAQIENDSESFAAGFDLLTGENKWKLDRPNAANWSSPTLLQLNGEDVVAMQSSKGIVGIVPSTGSPLFELGDGAATIPSSVAAGDRIYIPSNGLTAFKVPPDGGEPTELWNESAQRPGTASPLVLGDKVYVINNAGVLNCANKETGERIWRIRLKGPFSGSPVAANSDYLYIFNEAGVGQLVDLRGEEGVVVSEIELGETILSTPSLSDGALYIRSDSHLWSFSTP
ncbi:MAG: PQQ-binding-like beta-propeller repeat protein [Verrucomicrobiales bacterium]|nr:PQQ-binding-like beta-propeller repeat protein [Verrucomicrobiales bacterium]